MTTYTLTELHDKRAELAGLIIQADKQAREYRADLAHVEATIRILRPGIELPKIVPKRVEFRPRHFARGVLARLILDYMRDHAGETVAVAGILPLAIGDRSLNTAERNRVALGVYEALRRAERKGIVERAGEGWKAARRLLAAGFTRASHRLRCYVLIGIPKDTLGAATARLEQMVGIGFTPFAMLWRPDTPSGERLAPGPEWHALRRRWTRPAAIYASGAQQ